jgi:hypothetical protein
MPRELGSGSAGLFHDGIVKSDDKLLLSAGQQPDLLQAPGQLGRTAGPATDRRWFAVRSMKASEGFTVRRS